MFLVVGLGNPGKEFEKTRHNAGFMVIDKLQLTSNKFSDWRLEKNFLAEISEGKIDKGKIILAKPQTFMNNSGKAVKKLINNYQLTSNNLFVIHDDADLPLGILRIVKNRGSAGHKGVESVMRALKTQDFVRFRIGTKPSQSGKIPSRPSKFMAKFLVEQKITPPQEEILKKTIKKCVEAIGVALKEGVPKAMSKFNC